MALSVGMVSWVQCLRGMIGLFRLLRVVFEMDNRYNSKHSEMDEIS
jgi:hypothetical protein